MVALPEQRARGGDDRGARDRAIVWPRAALSVLRAAQRDLGAKTDLGQPFARAAAEIRRGNLSG